MKTLRKSLFLAFVLVCSSAVFAVNTKATLKKANVYFNGAELIHSASASLTSGENELSIEGLSPQIDLNSLKIKVNNGVMVTASEFSVNYLEPTKDNPSVKLLRDSLELYQADLTKVTTSIRINKDLLTLLRKGVEHNLSQVEKGATVAEINTNMDLYKTKATALEALVVADNKKKEQLDQQIARLNNQLQQEIGKGGKNTGVLKLTLAAPAATAATFSISYFTTSASWTPYYDINIASTDKPINILGKAKVRQTTGLDWNQVKLTLATAKPTFNKEASYFSTWFLDYVRFKSSMNYALEGQVAGVQVTDKNGVPGASSSLRIRGVGSIAESAPIYIIDDEIVSVDYAQSINPNAIKSIEIMKGAQAETQYGSEGKNGVVIITTKSMEDFITQTETALNVEYKMDMPFTIPGNGKEQTVDLKSYQTEANFNYYCAPKLDAETYLLAEIADWANLNLLSGKANITYDGSYVGETNINTNSTEDKLKLTLGTDKRVSVIREKVKDFSSVKTFGSTTKAVLTYKLTIKNNQTKAIHAVLKDQYPISTQKDIVVELLKETTPACDNNKETGVLTWELDLQPGESQSFTLSYSVQYPKGSRLNLE
jgi:TonB-dependent SusC/RagA subfamily outer membrane receptor